MLSYILDLVGVFAFGSYGAYRALQARMNLFGVVVCAGVVAMGGGTVRELILHGTPVYLVDYSYVGVVLLAATLAVVFFRRFDRLESGLVVLDAVGLGAFALFGAMRAADAGFGLGGMLVGGTLTAVGGGVLSDLLVGERPKLFHGDPAIVPTVLTVVGAWLLGEHRASPVVVVLLVAGAALIRVISVRQGWRVWTPHGRPEVRPSPGAARLSHAIEFPPDDPIWHEKTMRLERRS
ncbi:trimeric intracellular cation channel family protein [Actinoplanes sp. NPDC049265]|uniref:trimeric intracellular cation channel family protein n=1 Tax=Actinoplanes sp. NPDC049265 TaxID=3363902 RepID=UPI0037143FA9